MEKDSDGIMTDDILVVDGRVILRQIKALIPERQLSMYSHMLQPPDLLTCSAEAVIETVQNDVEDPDNITQAELELMRDRTIENWRDKVKYYLNINKHTRN